MKLYYLDLIASSGKIILCMNIKFSKKIFEINIILIIMLYNPIFFVRTISISKYLSIDTKENIPR